MKDDWCLWYGEKIKRLKGFAKASPFLFVSEHREEAERSESSQKKQRLLWRTGSV